MRLSVFAPALLLAAVLTALGSLTVDVSLPFVARDGAPPLRLLVVWCAAVATSLLAARGAVLPDDELLTTRSRGELASWRMFWLGIILIAGVGIPVLLLGGTGLQPDWPLLLRDVIGLFGLGLIAVGVASRVGMVVPWVYVTATQLLGIEVRPGQAAGVHPWAWLVQPPAVTSSWLWALGLLAVGAMVEGLAQPKVTRASRRGRKGSGTTARSPGKV